jgi:hypothetical protein
MRPPNSIIEAPHRAARSAALIALAFVACQVPTRLGDLADTDSGSGTATASDGAPTGGSASDGEGECVPEYVITKSACPDYSMSDGSGAGGGETMIVCGEVVDAKTGHIRIRARKYPGAPNSVFEDRPYAVRVSTNAGPCGPDSYEFVPSNDSPNGTKTEELIFTFASIWLEGQVEKAYCITGSLMPGEPDYDSAGPGFATWYWSDQIILTRVCQ